MQSIEYLVTGITVFVIFLIAISSLTSVVTNGLIYTSHQNLQAQAESVFESVLTNTGSPNNWGVTFTNPQSFGLAVLGGSNYVLDGNKILRLSSSYPYPLDYSFAQRSLGLKPAGLNFRLSFSQPLIASVNMQRNFLANTLGFKVQVVDTTGKPVPLATVSLNALLYSNVTVNLLNNYGSYVSGGSKYGWSIFSVTDSSTGLNFQVASVIATLQSDELGNTVFNIDLAKVFGLPGMTQNVPVIVATGQVSLANINVPFGYWYAAPGINLHILQNGDVSGYILKDTSVTPPKYSLVVYGSNSSTVWSSPLSGSNLDVGVLISTPKETGIATLYQATAWTAKNGQVQQMPLLGSGAPIQSLFTFNTIRSSGSIVFKDVLVFIDPLLLLSLAGTSQPLSFGPSSSGTIQSVVLQRFVLVDGYSYIAQFTLWR